VTRDRQGKTEIDSGGEIVGGDGEGFAVRVLGRVMLAEEIPGDAEVIERGRVAGVAGQGFEERLGSAAWITAETEAPDPNEGARIAWIESEDLGEDRFRFLIAFEHREGFAFAQQRLAVVAIAGERLIGDLERHQRSPVLQGGIGDTEARCGIAERRSGGRDIERRRARTKAAGGKDYEKRKIYAAPHFNDPSL